MLKSTLKSTLTSIMELLSIILKAFFPLVALFCVLSISDSDLKNIGYVIWMMLTTIIWHIHSKE